jgi:hypothetical protein
MTEGLANAAGGVIRRSAKANAFALSKVWSIVVFMRHLVVVLVYDWLSIANNLSSLCDGHVAAM